jgi:hypothetical protein
MLRVLTRAESGAIVFAAAVALIYGLLPLAVYLWLVDSPYFLQLGTVSAVGALAVVGGSRLGFGDRFLGRQRVEIGFETFLAAIWGSFLLFVIVACVTADRIPAVAALQGVDPDTLSVLRERFLKAREGWQASFVYVNALLAGALVPYSLVAMLLRRHRYRWVFFGLFLVYCVSFVEKAFFLRAAIPLLYVVVQRRISSAIRPAAIVAGAVGLLALVTVLSGASQRADDAGDGDFFSTAFSAGGTLPFLAWRAVAVPVVTAADTLRVFEETYEGRPLRGASSSLLAGLLGLERVAVERDVFTAQWGQTETETGSSNSVYLTEAFLNFGYPGVVVFSVLIGIILRLFAKSDDEALRSLWMLFCFGAFVAPLTATLFSNGFAAVIALSLLVRLAPAAADASASEAPEAG